MEVLKPSWEEIKRVWDTKLWPGRDSEPVTSMVFMGGYDMEYKKQEPVFLGIVVDGNLVAVNSYVLTHGTEYRSRGLWVDEEHRGQGMAKRILSATLSEIGDRGGSMVWTMPRRDAMAAYMSVGFRRRSDWIEQDWGTNCYAARHIE